MRFSNLLVWSVILLSFVQPRSVHAADEKAALQKTRQELRAKGFKTDVSDFNFAATSEEFTRSAAIKAADPASWNPGNRFRSSGLFSDLNLRSMITSNTALVVWKMERIGTRGVEPRATWEALHEVFEGHENKLDALAKALAEGRYAFDLNARAGSSMLLPHLPAMKNVAQAFTAKAMVELHDGHPAAAWSNVVAATMMATRWRVEPTEVSHMVQSALVTIAADAIWQTLQTNAWSDEQLAMLQREWESADWFAGLPEMIEFQGASAAQMCQMERTNSANLNLPIGDALRHPTVAVEELKHYQKRRDYLEHGSYEDEKALLQFSFDRQQEMKRALQCKTWMEMKPFATETNSPPIQQNTPSTARMRLNMLAMGRVASAFDGAPRTPLGKAAEAEARRRLVVTALALERFHRKNKNYPDKLLQLVPGFVTKEPVDFCDGKPLRYRRTAERFVLYSTGLDCSDDGGVVPLKPARPDYTSRTNSVAPRQDLVWPLPASAAEMAEKDRNDALEEQREKMAMQQRWAEHKKQRETELRELRQELLKVFVSQKPRKLVEAKVKGEPLSKVLRNDVALGTAKADLYELLTLRRVHNESEPECVAYELPIKYDALKHRLGEVRLLVDSPESLEQGQDKYESPLDFGDAQECRRATNGNCLLIWNTTYDPPGTHYVQAQLMCFGIDDRKAVAEYRGPLVQHQSTNLCEFDESYAEAVGGEAIFWAKLVEPKGECSIELKNPAGEHIKTLTGSTTNGEIRIKWDWLNDQGKRDTNQTIDTFYTIKLLESGHTQTLKGP